jgi:hypothetical protein
MIEMLSCNNFNLRLGDQHTVRRRIWVVKCILNNYVRLIMLVNIIYSSRSIIWAVKWLDGSGSKLCGLQVAVVGPTPHLQPTFINVSHFSSVEFFTKSSSSSISPLGYTTITVLPP